ncbi:MAG: VanZ family protein [Acidobacteria bacterium]|nr:VanZ family protein [Acidobacteriota bacterium]
MRFGTPSILYGARLVNFVDAASPGMTIELDLQPEDEPSWEIGSILSIIDRNRYPKLEIAQLKTGLLVRTPMRKSRDRRWYREVKLEAGLKRGIRRLIAITSSPQGTTVCLDGDLAARFPGLRLDASPIMGRLIVGIDPKGHRNWAGKMFGLAVFGRPLGSLDIARRWKLWRSGQFDELARESGVTALYFFSEGGGNLVQDHSISGCPLAIPSSYRLPQRRILVAPAEDWGFNYMHLLDAGKNILAFVPLGFFCFIHRAGRAPGRRVSAAGWTIVVSAALSMALELVQVYLPLRASSLTDLICNVSGACIGIAFAVPVLRFLGRSPEAAASVPGR